MSEVQISAPPEQPKPKSNCFMVGGITCLVIFVLLVGLGFWLFKQLSGNSMIKKAFGGAKLVAECQLNMANPSSDQCIYAALERYNTKYGRYPQKLGELYPTFLEKRSVLHCPADPSPKDTISYEYTPPAETAPANTIMVECNRHILIEGQAPLVLKLQKDGQVLKPNYATSGGPVDQPKPGN